MSASFFFYFYRHKISPCTQFYFCEWFKHVEKEKNLTNIRIICRTSEANCFTLFTYGILQDLFFVSKLIFSSIYHFFWKITNWNSSGDDKLALQWYINLHWPSWIIGSMCVIWVNSLKFLLYFKPWVFCHSLSVYS